MSLPTAYTPLESLLLFQALRSEGVNSHAVFNRISEQLKRISIVRNDPAFDSGRLSPDALRELYLWLLKGEVKRDLERQNERQDILQNGDVSPNSRKRKAPSPSLPTVHEASQHAHLIPQLVTRLYARYRDHTVKDIREHERRYDALTREIGEIKAGKWDERLQRYRTRTQSPRPSSSAHTQPALNRLDANQSTKSKTASPVGSQSTLENGSSGPVKPYKGNKIGDLINHGPEPQNDSGHHRRNSSNTSLPPLSEMAPQSPHFGIPAKLSGPISTQVPAHGYNHSPPSANQSPYPPQHGHPTPGTVAGPGLQHSVSRPSSSPRPILPPPPGMKLPPPSPVQHSVSPSLRGPPLQQYPNQPLPHAYPPGQLPLPHSGYYQQQPYADRRMSHPVTTQQYGPPTYPSHSGGYQPQPVSFESYDAAQGMPNQQYGQQYASLPPQSTPVPRQSHSQYAPSAPSTSGRLVPPANSRMVSDIIAALATPPRPKSAFKRPPHLSTGSPMPSPSVEPLSPVLKRSEPASRSTRTTRTRNASSAGQSAELEMLPMPPRTRGRPKRERSPHSVVSSTADESTRMTRSHSVSTAAGAIPTSDDRPVSRGNVKIEPSTPAGFVEIPDASHDQPSAGGPMTRKRRGTLQTQSLPQAKRKRHQSPDHESDEPGTPAPRSNTILATRNFHKMSATIMNDINTHKHASYFANPVRDKDAPGYSGIIKMPQNLKTIQKAIAAGAKAVNAAAATLDSPSGTPSASFSRAGAESSTVELERTEELMPPKAIVNSAQLEKEVMRMFANAVMFNPGEDGMVSDTREMFEDVEAKLAQWRGVEKEAGEGEDVEEEGKGKRRKL